MDYTVRKTSGAKRGSALVIALEISLLVAVLTTVLVQNALTENSGTDSLILDTQASYLAESGAEYAIRLLKYNVANNYPLPIGANVKVLGGYLANYTEFNTGETPRPVCEYRVIRIDPSAARSSVDVDGIDHHYQLYAVTGRGWVPDPVKPGQFIETFVSKMVDLDFVPLFQYLAFYNRFDMEILPGNNMALQGRIHSNRDLYIGVQAGRTLSLNSSSVKSSGSMHRHRKDKTTAASDYNMTGNVMMRRKTVSETAPINATNYPAIDKSGQLRTPSGLTVPLSVAPSGYDSSFSGYDGNGDGFINTNPNDLAGFNNGVQAKFEGTMQVGANGVPVLEAPTDIRAYRPPVNDEVATHTLNSSTGLYQPAASGATTVPGSFMSRSNLVIESSNTMTRIRDGAGTELFRADGTGAIQINLLKDSAGNAIVPVTQTQIFDGREYAGSGDSSGMIKVTDIDMYKLNGAFRTDGSIPMSIFPPSTENSVGSIIYAYRTDTSVGTPNGVRLTNGAVLNNKLTFVSESPVYIKGDFNKMANKKGAIILADSVNLLSNQWNDTKTKDTGLPLPSSDLEINAAMMTGAYETIAPDVNGNNSKYNGGFENFPRFHENWTGSGRAVNIRGSFISLFESTYGKGTWVYGGNKYTAPVRNWDFDKDFLRPENHPPGFPVSVGETRVAWWKGRNLQWWPIP